MLIQATLETIYMVFGSCFFAVIFGLPLGSYMYMIRPGGLYEKRWLYRALSSVVNATRSLPFVILMILLMPLTRKVVGTSIGVHAALVPLSLGAIPFVARLVETAFQEISPGLIDMMISLGIKPVQLFQRVLIPESLPILVQGVTLTLVSLVGYSAMAGSIGGGGLGDLAIRYGYQRFNVSIMIYTVMVLIFLVHAIQSLGDRVCFKLNKKARVTKWV